MMSNPDNVYVTDHIRKSKPGACLWRKWTSQARATTETAVRRCERSTKEPIAKDSWASCGYTTLNRAILSKYELLRASANRQFASARRQIRTGLFFRSNLCRFCSKFAWALPLSLSSPWTMNFFLRNDKYGQEMKISSKCPTSAIASPHVKYVKGW